MQGTHNPAERDAVGGAKAHGGVALKEAIAKKAEAAGPVEDAATDKKHAKQHGWYQKVSARFGCCTA